MRRIMNFYYRFTNAAKFFLSAFKSPEIWQESNLQMLTKLFEMIMKVATEDRHVMTHIAYVHPDEGEKQIVSIWAGAGAGAEPTKRISELLEENAILKSQLKGYINKENINSKELGHLTEMQK